MTVPTDPFTFVNGTTADATQVNARYGPLYAALNGALDVDNLLAAVKTKLGLSDAGNVRRGKSIVPTEETRPNVAYGLMTTPDRVSSVVLPADALLVVAFQALFKSSVATAGRAAIFVGSNQVKIQDANQRAAVVQEAATQGTDYDPVTTFGGGLIAGTASAGDHSDDVSTGQVLGVNTTVTAFYGGPCYIHGLPAGTYDVSVQFRAGAGSVSVKGRKLFVWTLGF